MVKGTAVRQREKKLKSSLRGPEDKPEVARSSRELPRNGEQIKENSRSENFWKYCTLSLLLLLSCVSLFYSKGTTLFSRLSSFIPHDSFDTPENVDFPCNLGEFSIDRRSNLSLEEFIHCYDAKRYSSFVPS